MARPRVVSKESKAFSLRLEPELLAALHRATARRQLQTGERVSLASLMTQILEEFVRREEGDTALDL